MLVYYDNNGELSVTILIVVVVVVVVVVDVNSNHRVLYLNDAGVVGGRHRVTLFTLLLNLVEAGNMDVMHTVADQRTWTREDNSSSTFPNIR